MLNSDEGLMLPLISVVYTLPYFIGGTTFVTFLLLQLYIMDPILTEQQITISVLMIALFEFIKPVLKKISKDDYAIDNLYDNLIDNFNSQVLKFSGFLDDFSRNFIQSKDYKTNLDESFDNLINTYCKSCSKNKECFTRKKLEVYTFFKTVLKEGRNIKYQKQTIQINNFIRYCSFSHDIINTANLLNNKFDFSKTISTQEQSLISQMEGLSNTIRQYTIDMTSKQELNLISLFQLKESLIKRGYKILSFHIKRAFQNDFCIEVGILDIHPEEVKTIVKHLAEKQLATKVSIEISNYEKSESVYFSIIPSINFDITHGHGSIAKDGFTISGDNCLVKDLNNGSFIAAISDGMGNGYSAYNESKQTLKLINKITEFEISTSTSMNILNTFYSLKNDMDNYATLDFLEINRSNGVGNFYKMGATTTFILRGTGNLERIVNTNLPFGYTDLIKQQQVDFNDKDLVILVSDGIIEKIENEQEFESHIKSISHLSPQKIAYEIINYSIEYFNNKAIDDMSVVALKLERRAA